MSSAEVDIVRRFMELSLERREFDAAFALAHPDAEFDWSNSMAPYRGVYRGAEAKTFLNAWLDAWDEWKTEITEAINLGPETILIVTRVRARGRGSGVTVDAGGCRRLANL